MVTKGLLLRGYNCGLVRFVLDPVLRTGTVCQIGEHYFHFDGPDAENNEPVKYLSHVPVDDALQKAYQALEAFREDETYEDEYLYYTCYLRERVEVVYKVMNEDTCSGYISDKEKALERVSQIIDERLEKGRTWIRITVS